MNATFYRKIFLLISFLTSSLIGFTQVGDGKITVSGSSSISVAPNLINVEIGTTEYYKKTGKNDSVKVTLAEIDKKVSSILNAAMVPDSLITLNQIGNYYWGQRNSDFLMGRSITATLTDISQLEFLSENLGIPGITSFRIASTDRSDMEKYNLQGLSTALDRAREKAESMMKDINGKIICPVEIEETGPVYYDEVENVVTAMDGSPMMLRAAKNMSFDNLRKITRRYNVKVTYLFITQQQETSK